MEASGRPRLRRLRRETRPEREVSTSCAHSTFVRRGGPGLERPMQVFRSRAGGRRHRTGAAEPENAPRGTTWITGCHCPWSFGWLMCAPHAVRPTGAARSVQRSRTLTGMKALFCGSLLCSRPRTLILGEKRWRCAVGGAPRDRLKSRRNAAPSRSLIRLAQSCWASQRHYGSAADRVSTSPAPAPQGNKAPENRGYESKPGPAAPNDRGASRPDTDFRSRRGGVPGGNAASELLVALHQRFGVAAPERVSGSVASRHEQVNVRLRACPSGLRGRARAVPHPLPEPAACSPRRYQVRSSST